VTAGLLVVNFGGPRSEAELEPFLTELLLDVLPGPPALKHLVAPAIARARARKVLPQYQQIGWSAVVPTHFRQIEALEAALGPDRPLIASGMMFTPPTMRDAIRQLRGCDRLIVLPMFPHYSLATTGAAFGFAWEALVQEGMEKLPIHWIPAWFEHPRYLDALAATIRRGVEATPGDGPLHLVFSPHGLPLSFVRRGDPYPDQVRTSIRRVIERLGWTDPWHLGWQSRLGPTRWLEPSTPATLAAVAAAGGHRVCLVPISFVSEHIETLYEIDVDYREAAHRAGIEHFGRAPALGLEPAFVECLADLVRKALDPGPQTCVRCLIPQSEDRRRRASCPTCGFRNPAFLRRGVSLR
jgi:ferrochelatase